MQQTTEQKKLEKYKTVVAEVLGMMGAVFRDAPDENIVEAWTTIMIAAKVKPSELKAAALDVMSTRRYNKLPPPAEILDIIRPRVDHNVEAEAQADLVLKLARRLGPDRKPDIEDPITKRLMSERWPWYSWVNGLESDQVKWWRREFTDAYTAAKSTGEVKRLPGKHEAPELKSPDLALVRTAK